jgi:plastocyanin
MLVLGLSCAIPAISAAQDAGTTTATSTTTTQAEPPAPAPSPPPTDGSSEGTAAGTPGKAPDQSRTADTPLADSPPADAPSGGATAAASPKARKAASASVTIGDFFFSPTSVTIAVGDTVTWRNTGQAPHNATADDGSFKTPDLNQGHSASHTFTTAGTFSYICTIHPNMKGTVRVLSSSASGGGGASSSSSSGSANSEASAVASPDAAGNSNTLPMTGMAVGTLALVGFALLGLGLIARKADRERSRPRWLPFF